MVYFENNLRVLKKYVYIIRADLKYFEDILH